MAILSGEVLAIGAAVNRQTPCGSELPAQYGANDDKGHNQSDYRTFRSANDFRLWNRFGTTRMFLIAGIDQQCNHQSETKPTTRDALILPNGRTDFALDPPFIVSPPVPG